MRETPTSTQSPANGNPAASSRADAYGEIAACARDASSPEELFSQSLRHIAAAFDSPYGAMYVRDGARIVDDSCHNGSTDPAFWKAQLQQFLTDALTEGKPKARLLNPKRGSTKVAFLAAPIEGVAGAKIGAVALVVTRHDDLDVMRKMTVLESLTRFMSCAADLVVTQGGQRRRDDPAQPNQSLARSGRFRTPEELAFAITNHLRNKLGCEQIAMGMALRRSIHILSVSGLDRVVRRSEGVRHLRAAMEECLDAGEPIVSQDAAEWDNAGSKGGHRLHKQWRTAAGGDSVASIPLRAEEKVVAVLSVRKRSGDHFTDSQIEEIRKHVEPFAAALLLTRRASRTLFTHLRDAAAETAQLCANPEKKASKLLALAMLVAATWFAFGSIPYEVTVPCVITASEGRYISAPADGVLAAVAVTVGDRVRAGQTLCTFDSKDIEHERAELRAQIAVLEREKDRALAENVPVEFQLALANQKLARAKLETSERRLARATVRAPIDGVIVSGDLRALVGAVMMKGTPLFEMASPQGCRVELRVPERDVDDIGRRAVGRFAAHAKPELTLPFRVQRISPRAAIDGEKNVFLAEAEVETPFDWLRPGMEGIARIEAGERRVWWVVLHRAVDYLRMTFWL